MSLWRTNTGELVGVVDLLFGDWIGLERIRTCVIDELDGDLVAALPLCGCCDRVMALMDSADLRCAFRRIGRLAMVIKKSLGIGKGRRLALCECCWFVALPKGDCIPLYTRQDRKRPYLHTLLYFKVKKALKP